MNGIKVAARDGRIDAQSRRLSVRRRNIDQQLRLIAREARDVLGNHGDDGVSQKGISAVLLHDEGGSDLRAATVSEGIVQEHYMATTLVHHFKGSIP